jgi:hypothetical protein
MIHERRYGKMIPKETKVGINLSGIHTRTTLRHRTDKMISNVPILLLHVSHAIALVAYAKYQKRGPMVASSASSNKDILAEMVTLTRQQASRMSVHKKWQIRSAHGQRLSIMQQLSSEILYIGPSLSSMECSHYLWYQFLHIVLSSVLGRHRKPIIRIEICTNN